MAHTKRPDRAGFEVAADSDEVEETIKPMECEPPSSEAALPNGEEEIMTTQKLSRIPRFFRYENRPPEATALALDVLARATILMSSIFLGPGT